MSGCVACNPRSVAIAGRLDVILAETLGRRWWAAEDPAEAAARVSLGCLRGDRSNILCGRHAAWIATLARLRIEQERRWRDLAPGEVLVEKRELLDGMMFEPLSRVAAKLDGDPIVEIARRFVSGSTLSAVVIVDVPNARAGLYLQVAGSDPPLRLWYASERLAATTPQAILDGLRQRAAAG